MPTLLLTDEAGESRRVPLRGSDTKVGRSAGNELVLDSRRVSRFHAVLVRQGRAVTLRDLGSTNGSFVNGARVTTCPLMDGDTLQLGDIELHFLDDDASGVAELPPLLPMAGASDNGGRRWEEPIETERARISVPPSVSGRARGVAWIGDAVSFTFAAEGRPVAGLITYEALVDHFGARAHALDVDSRAIEAYVQNHLAINVAASLRYAEIPKEPVLLRTTHF